MITSNSARKGYKASRPRCNPPRDCFSCKHPDCIAGITMRTTEDEKKFYAISGNRVNMRGVNL